jgi:hypothetical protein
MPIALAGTTAIAAEVLLGPGRALRGRGGLWGGRCLRAGLLLTRSAAWVEAALPSARIATARSAAAGMAPGVAACGPRRCLTAVG